VWGSWTTSQRCRAAKRASSARAQRGRMPVTGLIIVPCLAALSVIDPGAIGQEVVEQYRWRMAMDPTVLSVDQEKEKAAKPGSDFKECANGCPVMIVIPAGKFIMGSPENESDRNASEGPRHEVTVAKPFAVSKFEVTFEEWDACVAAAACPRVTDHWGGGNMPIINVSWDDAKQYVGWLSQLTGKEYRLLTEAEWEYAARAGANTRYSWGDDPRMGNANCDGCGSQWDLRQTAPVGSFKPNALGLYDMHGNVWEWVEDSWHENYHGAPADGSAWLRDGDPSFRVVRGGSWRNESELVRAAVRVRRHTKVRFDTLGFRVARTIGP
jgi:formylglycine-generating enzyme required for sulfatase activity